MKIHYFFILLFLSFAATAQQNAVTSGGNASGSGGSVSYSIGQAFYHPKIEPGDAVSLLEGVQQPIEIIPLAVENPTVISNVSVYPNPAFSGFNVSCADFIGTEYTLFDSSGKTMDKGKLESKQTFVKTEQLPKGIYFLQLNKSGKQTGYKIIKS